MLETPRLFINSWSKSYSTPKRHLAVNSGTARKHFGSINVRHSSK